MEEINQLEYKLKKSKENLQADIANRRIDKIDNISIDEVTINSDGFNSNVVNVYGVTYTVTDSWGREAKASRTLTIQKGLERHELIFGGRNGREEDLPAFKLKLVEENNKPKINFEALIDAQILAKD